MLFFFLLKWPFPFFFFFSLSVLTLLKSLSNLVPPKFNTPAFALPSHSDRSNIIDIILPYLNPTFSSSFLFFLLGPLQALNIVHSCKLILIIKKECHHAPLFFKFWQPVKIQKIFCVAVWKTNYVKEGRSRNEKEVERNNNPKNYVWYFFNFFLKKRVTLYLCRSPTLGEAFGFFR